MKWSKLKQRIEEGFADSVQGRVEVWITRYHRAHDQEGEGLITVDKQRAHSMGSLGYFKERYSRSSRLLKERGCEDFRNPAQRRGYLEVEKEVDEMLQEAGIIDHYEFSDRLFEYLNLSIENILVSKHAVIRALGMLDRRLGKRRLKILDVSSEPELVQLFYELRCEFEGIRPVTVETRDKASS